MKYPDDPSSNLGGATTFNKSENEGSLIDIHLMKWLQKLEYSKIRARFDITQNLIMFNTK
jgi:hypothetical protein